MKKYIFNILVVAVLSSVFNLAQAQSISSSQNELVDPSKPYQMGSYLNDRLSLKIGYNFKSSVNVELNYAFKNIVEVGLFTGLNRYSARKSPDSTYIDALGNTQHLFFGAQPNPSPFSLLMGANLNIHILPLFIQKKKLRYDLYISNKFYTAYAFIPKSFDFKTRFLPFHAETGLGFSCFFTKKFGMYIEASYQYQNALKSDIIYSLENPEEENIGKILTFHTRIGFVFKLSK